MSWHVIQVEKFPTVQLSSVVSQKPLRILKNPLSLLAHYLPKDVVHFICICGNMTDGNLGKQTLLVFISVSLLVHINQSNIG